ncbi:MAG: glutamate--cysteine ligase [Candidatus Tokpelaia sp.]|nr:MAG: glutamate--cysteine ligase [Candidatus Tokpelaia sp.]KAA6207319.1 MAG: glutamate--cysteine ligase [Candidatus Tokpelaia sp.]
MARDIIDNRPIDGLGDLVAYLSGGGKAKTAWRIGTEHEKFPFYREGNRPVPYGGAKGIRALLQGMQAALGWKPIIDAGRIVGLFDPAGRGAISLEPGGQFELSGAPLHNVHQTCREVQSHLAQLQHIAEPIGIGFLGLGASPAWSLAQTPHMPKSRYKLMADYMPKMGKSGLDMMFRTATVQVNLDFADEADMRRKMQVAMKLQPLATALFASSPFRQGRPCGLLSWRSEIWRNTDKNRTGLLPFIFSPSFGFADYVDWALNIPMYFVLRRGHYYNATNASFRQFLNGALRRELTKEFSAKEAEPVMSDWINHLSTLFPEVRLKRFLEMRGADGSPQRNLCALPAFWAGLLYDDTALSEAEALTRDWSYEEVLAVRNSVPQLALKTGFRRTDLQKLAGKVLKIARKGLKNRAQFNQTGADESCFLAPLEEIVAGGKTVAEQMLSRYHGSWENSVAPLFHEYAY